MSENFQDFVRKPFAVRAIRVTLTNIDRLAEESGGVLKNDGQKEGHFSRQYIFLDIPGARNQRQKEAHVGDWLVKQGGKFKIYPDKQFQSTFDPANGRPMAPAKKQGKKSPKPQAPREGVSHRRPSPAMMPKKKSERAELSDEQKLALGFEDDGEGNLPVVYWDSLIIPEEVRNPGETIPNYVGRRIAELRLEKVNPEAAQARRSEELSVDPVAREIDEVMTELKGAKDIEREQRFNGVKPGTPTLKEYAEATAPVVEPKAITLDELNAQAGDPRSAQEIMSEQTPGERFRGEA